MDLELIARFFENDRFARENGIRLVELRTGYARAEMPVGPRHHNAVGILQGGALFTLADLAFAAASNSHGVVAVACQADLTWFKAVSAGKLTATAEEISRSRRLETALVLQGHRRAIIVDAADMGCAPGEWARFTRDQVALEPAEMGLRSTLHSAGLAEALALGEALGILPKEIVMYGVQPEAIDWSPGLSAAVQAAVPAICAAILAEI